MKVTHWTPEQLAALLRLYPTLPPAGVAAAIGRPLKSVYNKACHLGIKSFSPPGGCQPKPKLESTPCLPAAKPAKATARGPAYLVGEPIITAKTRFVVGPSPQQSLRSNTFLE